MLDVSLISMNIINWDNYLIQADKFLARAITKSLDERNLFKKDLGSFIATIAEMRKEDSNPYEVWNNPGSLLDHAFCVFSLIATEKATYEIIEHTRLNFTKTESIHHQFLFSIISGTLSQLRTAIINCSVLSVSTDIRLFVNQLMIYLEEMGLVQVFIKYTKVENYNDGTFYLRKD